MLGARNLGGSIAADLIEHGWRVASVARSAESLAIASRALGATPLAADATDPADLAQALQAATAATARRRCS